MRAEERVDLEQPAEFGIGVVAQLARADGRHAGLEQDFLIRRQAANFMQVEQRPTHQVAGGAGVGTAGGQMPPLPCPPARAGFVGFGGLAKPRLTHSAVSVSLTLNTWTRPALDRKVPECGRSGAELVEVLEDRPELHAVAGHQPHGALDRFEPAEGGELIEQEQHRHQRLHAARQVGHGLRHHQAEPAAVGAEPVRYGRL